MAYATAKTGPEPFVATGQPCPCGQSSDAYAYRSNGSGKCFSCSKVFPVGTSAKGVEAPQKEKVVENLTYQSVTVRGVLPSTLKAFKVKVGCDDKGPVNLYMPHPSGRVQVKGLRKKDFWWEGTKDSDVPLYGMDIFPANSAKILTITEGLVDGMSVYQMFGNKYPVVSVTSASSARSECAKAFNYIDSFEKIYLCLDADKPGREAAQEVARLFDFNKVYIVDMMHHKDPNAYLENGDADLFTKTWWSASRFMPEGFLSSYTDFDKVIDDDSHKPSVPYPFEQLQSMTYGIRTGELVLLTAQEGIGKTEIFRSLEYHLLKTTDDNIGIIHLEENKARSIKGLVGYELQSPIHLPDYAISKDEIKKHIRTVAGRDERLHLYSHFGSDNPDTILSAVRFMAGSCNCKRVFLDHITMVVSGLEGEDERKALDYISTRLAMMVEELDFTLFLISHVNDSGQTRGSRNIGKVADLRVDMKRDIQAASLEERNTTYLTVTKNRFAGKTGPAGQLYFDPDTYVLSEKEEEIPQ